MQIRHTGIEFEDFIGCLLLVFWKKHGLQATCEAFAVGRRTLFRWKALRTQRCRVTPISTADRQKRKRLWPMQLHQHIRKVWTQYLNCLYQ